MLREDQIRGMVHDFGFPVIRIYTHDDSLQNVIVEARFFNIGSGELQKLIDFGLRSLGAHPNSNGQICYEFVFDSEMPTPKDVDAFDRRRLREALVNLNTAQRELLAADKKLDELIGER